MVYGISNDFVPPPSPSPLPTPPFLSSSLFPSPVTHPGEHAGDRTEVRSSEGAPLEATDEKTASHVATARLTLGQVLEWDGTTR